MASNGCSSELAFGDAVYVGGTVRRYATVELIEGPNVKVTYSGDSRQHWVPLRLCIPPKAMPAKSTRNRRPRPYSRPR